MSVDASAQGTSAAHVPDPAVVHARATVKPEKAAAVAELAKAFRTSNAAVLTEYRGLTVKQVTALRAALGADTTYAVVKNTLTKLAAADAGLSGLEALLAGPTAVAFIQGEPVEAAKALRDYARANPALVVKGGVLDGRPLTADEIRKLADLESREVLLAKMAGAMKASLTQAVYLFSAPLVQVARLAAALQEKAEQDPSVLRGTTSEAVLPTPTADGAPVDQAVADGAPSDEAVADGAPAESVVADEPVEAPVVAPEPGPADATVEPVTAADDTTAADDSPAEA